jgi:hypothetical protein
MATATLAPAGEPAVGSSFYLVRPDPRLCPSPRCGGYWVSLVNREHTRCSDGELQRRCYVARAVDEHRHPRSGLPAGAVARATLELWRFEGLGVLGVLVVARAFAPVGTAIETGTFYRLRDTGVRCIRSPCFSLRATPLNRSSRKAVSDLDLAAAGIDPADLARAEAALGTPGGLLVRGRLTATAEGGRALRASRVYLT